jgi:hypothetical protein
MKYESFTTLPLKELSCNLAVVGVGWVFFGGGGGGGGGGLEVSLINLRPSERPGQEGKTMESGEL